MEFRTKVNIPRPDYSIAPCERMLLVGSCFADNLGRRFADYQFRATVNPYGVMYNPASILHTVTRFLAERPADSPAVVFLTLGTNHVYVEKATGEIVDNCRKRPQRLFDERQLDVEACLGYLSQAVGLLLERNPQVKVTVTVSPIRYAKYGYHESQLSKATLLLAADRLVSERECCSYFPAYEIVNDELRDYRFYAEDMLHPSAQAVDYIWEIIHDHLLSDEARAFVREWEPLRRALQHRPFHPESEEYKAFMDKTMLKITELSEKYPTFAWESSQEEREEQR